MRPPERLRMKKVFENIGMPSYSCIYLGLVLLACGNLCTAFAFWKKISEGLLCRFACFYLMMFMRSACGWNGCGPRPLIVLFGYSCLLHMTNPKSRCCKWRWCWRSSNIQKLVFYLSRGGESTCLNRCFSCSSPHHIQLCLYVQCIIFASCVSSLEFGKNGVPFPLPPTLCTARICCLPFELVVPL